MLGEAMLETRSTEIIAAWMNTICNVALVSSLYINYEIWISWSQTAGNYSPYDTLYNTGVWKWLIFEIIINMLAPYWFFKGIKYTEEHPDAEVTLTYEFNDLLLCFSFIRLYLPIKLYLYSTEFINPRSHRVCRANGCEASSLFAIKCLVQQRPYAMLISSLMLSVVVFGYQLKIFEGPMSDYSGMNFKNFNNCMWNVVITLSSAGYGEFYPVTFFGRIIGVIICFWGVFIVSMFVVIVSSILEFAP